MHDVVLPLQFPFDWHVLLLDPPRVYPVLQLNATTLRYVTPLPDFPPLVGALKEEQVDPAAASDQKETSIEVSFRPLHPAFI